MKKLLAIWIEDENQHIVPLSKVRIQKAKSSYEDLKSRYGEYSVVESFSASCGWFGWYKKHCNSHNIKLTGEEASADDEVAEAFPA